MRDVEGSREGCRRDTAAGVCTCPKRGCGVQGCVGLLEREAFLTSANAPMGRCRLRGTVCGATAS